MLVCKGLSECNARIAFPALKHSGFCDILNRITVVLMHYLASGLTGKRILVINRDLTGIEYLIYRSQPFNTPSSDGSVLPAGKLPQ